ncbi:unnamed protein product [Spirodela intermedia]|uniref:Uncharacterized protein n=1 Tax=Spirodela intermedia TaxID=51605 RepID=A0A7I8L9H8_SPIIN|nr:unnamed protein product [Spirodela intermedia]
MAPEAEAERVGGGVVLVLLLLLLCNSAGGETDSGGTAPSLLDLQEAQLARLESLAESLSQSVSRLESALSERSRPPAVDGGTAIGGSTPAFTADGGEEGTADDGALEPQSGVTVTKYKPSWPERFHFAAAARLQSAATCAIVLPYEDYEGLSKYFAVGDAHGRAYVFSSAGDVLLELPIPPSEAPVTAMLAYASSRRNESLLFIGHGDGSIVAHRLGESTGAGGAAAGDEWVTLTVGSSRPFLRGGNQEAHPILSLGVYAAGRVKYVVASDGGGRIRVFTENGTLYGTAAASSRPLAFARQRLLFLTETGAGSLDLRTMTVRETDCEGLNGTRAASYAFDVSERSKAYGFTGGGLLVQVVLLGDAASFKCRVRTTRKVEMEGPVAMQSIRGYLLAVNHEKVFVFNVSSHHYGRTGAPRPLFSASLQEIKSLFLRPRSGGTNDLPAAPPGKPLIAGDREKLLILGLGGGYVGIYRSNFPAYKSESNAVLWSSPVLVFLLFLIGIWHFYVKKKDVLGWTQEDFNHTSLPSGADREREREREISFGDGSVGGGEIRGGPAIRPMYVSPPSRYAGGSAVPFRPGPGDPGFRGPSDLKYRAQRMEPPGFPKRRDPMATNTQTIAEDHID